MLSLFSSRVAGAILAPVLPQFALNKLLDSLLAYLSEDRPSSSGEVDKLHNEGKAWAEAIQKLEIIRSDVRRLHKRDKQNMRLIHINNKLRDVSHEIKDLKDDLEYMELQRKVEEINLQDEADKSTSGTRERRSWIPWTTGQSSDKRRRLSSSEFTDDAVSKMRTIIEQINSIEADMNKAIKLDALSNIGSALKGGYDSCGQHQVAENKRVTTSSPTESKIYGRDYEFRRLVELLKEPNVSGNVSVVSIVGMGGIGKTTLAQFVYHNTEIANQFDKKAWICVSDNFDRHRITKEILDSFSIGDGSSTSVPFGNTTSLDVLETKIKGQVTGKKFLLVLDDVWSDEWQQLLHFLRCAQAEAIKLIVTCRDPKISGVSAYSQNQITLKGLSDGECWLFFQKCVFADNNPDDYPQRLHDIGKQIVGKLKGSPLAAKTVGRLLGTRLTEAHWKDISESDLWKLETDAHGIMSALALSYYHLSEHLQLCFTFCSVFPKDFVYDLDSVIAMWVAHGYIQEIEGCAETMEDIGEKYWHDLQARGFFEKWQDWLVEEEEEEEEEDYRRHFKMHDLLHDLAQSVSHGETYIYNGRKDEEIPKDVRHLCALSFFDLELASKTNNLRTLVLYGAGDIRAILNHRAFKRIRVLIIFSINMLELPDDIAYLKHLQYLGLENTNIKSIPASLCGFYLLRVLKLPCTPPALPSQFHNLINLRRFHFVSPWIYQKNRHNVIYLVRRDGGYHIAQLRNMNELRGKLVIGGLGNIDNIEELRKHKYLKKKHHVKKLLLRWRGGCKHDVQEQVLEALEPHPNLIYLHIERYMGSKSPSWLVTDALQNLQSIILDNCRNWARLPAALGLLPFLKILKLIRIENMTIEGDDSVAEMYPSLQSLGLTSATLSFEGMSALSSSPSSSSSSSSSSLTIPGHRKWFPRLQNLEGFDCDRVSGFPWPMPAALEKLSINNIRGLQGQVPSCLQNLNCLSKLYIRGLMIETNDEGAQQRQQFLLPNLRVIKIECCENMAFLGDLLLGVTSLKRLTIGFCSPVCLPALGHLSVLEDMELEDVEVTVKGVTPVFPSLHTLKLMPEASMKVTVEGVTPVFPSLRDLTLIEASMKVTVEGVTPVFPSLEFLQLTKASMVFQNNSISSSVTTQNHNHFPKLTFLLIEYCDEVNGLLCADLISLEITEDRFFLPNLRHMRIVLCEDLETLPAWLPRLPLLKELAIIGCPKVHSLPEGGLPPSLEMLHLEGCDQSLMERCQQRGSREWRMTQHIPQRKYS